MRLTYLFPAAGLLVGCGNVSVVNEKAEAPAENHAEFEANKAIVMAAFAAHENEDLEGWAQYFSDDLQHESPVYDAGTITLEEHREQVMAYHQHFDNIKFTKGIWLAGVDGETNLLDGSVRCYGTWTSVHTGTGTELSLRSYHFFNFENGKIIQSGDFFDYGGMMAAIPPPPPHDSDGHVHK
jgi:ketosteroid isomerase-like protein